MLRRHRQKDKNRRAHFQNKRWLIFPKELVTLTGQTLKAILDERLLIGDGAMGTYIYSKGVLPDSPFEYANISNPDIVMRAHMEYIQSGADIIETNTFAANRQNLGKYGLQNKVRDICIEGVRLARSAADSCSAASRIIVAGSVGPVRNDPGAVDAPDDTGDEDALIVIDAFREQISALLEGGVDILIFETFEKLDELVLALGIAKSLSDVATICQMVFHETAALRDVQHIVDELRAAGADVVGANCGHGPLGIVKIAEKLAATGGRYLSAFPNACFPEIVGGRRIYRSAPEYFAENALRLARLGVNIIGGCCGTTPDYIRLVRKKLEGIAPAKRELDPAKRESDIVKGEPNLAKEKFNPAERELNLAREGARPAQEKSNFAKKELNLAKGKINVPAAVRLRINEDFPETARNLPGKQPAPPTSFLDKLGRSVIVTVELDPPKSPSADEFIRAAERLRDAGVDAINVAENPLAIVRMSSLAAGYLIQKETGLPAIVHLTCRDRNLIGQKSHLLGASALGINSILAVTGDPVPRQDGTSKITSVYDTGSYGLIELIKTIGPDFNIGVAFNANARNLASEVTRLRRKVALGANFAQTQPVFDRKRLYEVHEATKEIDIPIFIGILPLVSLRNAEFLHNEFPGISIPPSVMDRLRSVPKKRAVDEGLMIAQDIIEEAIRIFPGIYIIPPFNRVDLAIELAEQANEMHSALPVRSR